MMREKIAKFFFKVNFQLKNLNNAISIFSRLVSFEKL